MIGNGGNGEGKGQGEGKGGRATVSCRGLGGVLASDQILPAQTAAVEPAGGKLRVQ